MRIIIPLICLLLYTFVPQSLIPSLGVSNTHLSACLYYHFFHASWLHVIINGICFYLLYNPVRALWHHRFPQLSIVNYHLSTVNSAILAGLFAAKDIPTVGLSGVIFAMLGQLLLLNPTKKQLINFVYVAIAVIFQCFFGHSNVGLHIYAFVFGALSVILLCAIDRLRIKDDDAC